MPLALVVALALIAWAGWAIHLQGFFGVLVPYLAALAFVVGFCMKVVDWAKSAVPFKIPTTAGQQKTLPWINYSRLDNPFTTKEVVLRMFFEVFFCIPLIFHLVICVVLFRCLMAILLTYICG